MISMKRLISMEIHLGNVVYHLLCGERSMTREAGGIRLLSACGSRQYRWGHERQNAERCNEA